MSNYCLAFVLTLLVVESCLSGFQADGSFQTFFIRTIGDAGRESADQFL